MCVCLCECAFYMFSLCIHQCVFLWGFLFVWCGCTVCVGVWTSSGSCLLNSHPLTCVWMATLISICYLTSGWMQTTSICALVSFIVSHYCIDALSGDTLLSLVFRNHMNIVDRMVQCELLRKRLIIYICNNKLPKGLLNSSAIWAITAKKKYFSQFIECSLS